MWNTRWGNSQSSLAGCFNSIMYFPALTFFLAIIGYISLYREVNALKWIIFCKLSRILLSQLIILMQQNNAFFSACYDAIEDHHCFAMPSFPFSPISCWKMELVWLTKYENFEECCLWVKRESISPLQSVNYAQ